MNVFRGREKFASSATTSSWAELAAVLSIMGLRVVWCQVTPPSTKRVTLNLKSSGANPMIVTGTENSSAASARAITLFILAA